MPTGTKKSRPYCVYHRLWEATKKTISKLLEVLTVDLFRRLVDAHTTKIEIHWYAAPKQPNVQRLK